METNNPPGNPISHPLTNPSAEQVDAALKANQTIVQSGKEQTDKTQLQLPTPEQPKVAEFLGNLKHQLKRREVEIELMPFWRGLGMPFALVTSIATFVIIFGAGLLKFNSFGPQIPFYYNAIDGKWEDASKSIILFVPILYIIIMSVALRLVYDIFRYDHRLSNIMSWVITVVNILILVAVGQIYSLITVG